jgi:para-aminobenzoate synthetase component 1
VPSRILTGGRSPLEAAERFIDLPGVVLLESPPGFARLGERSYLSADPVARAARPDVPPAGHLALGMLAYEYGHRFEHLPRTRYDDLRLPDAAWGIHDWWIEWDHRAGEARLHATSADRLAWAAARWEGPARTPRPVAAPLAEGARPAEYPAPELGPAITSTFTAGGYRAAVARVVEYIRAGDIFQANLSQRFAAPFTRHPWELYRELRRASPAPFCAYLQHDDHAVISHSPERFLHTDAQGRIETRPIKGTRPRGTTPRADAALAAELRASEKDRAEHVMIVDLLRNDLSRVSEPGSVRCEELMALESYASVHHLVSTVRGALTSGSGPAEILAATFPGGSITGAPKIRAMEIIAELEPTARGVYCGAIGAIRADATLDLSIAIRTAVVRDGRVTWSAGGGIVADSDPAEEYRETLAKARAIAVAVGASQGRRDGERPR